MDKNNYAVFCLFVRSFFDSKNKKKRRKKMKVLIGTKNPGKIEGAKRALQKYFKSFEIEGVKVSSDVNEQPVGVETFEGALNRVNNLINYAKENKVNADMYISVESGLTSELGFWAITNIAVIKNAKGEMGVGSSASFPVPNKYVESIKEETLGVVMDRIFDETDLRSSTGGIGLLTKDVMTRIDLTTEAFLMALTPFINENWKDNVADVEKSR